jgi:pimeloyl-ACP methyl ester carboxylesterase
MKRLIGGFVLALLLAAPVAALAQAGIGIVIMHGKGGSPTGLVADLARTLDGKGYAVANIEMPWSGRRNYDVPASRGVEEVEAAVAGLRAKGAKKVFVAGHSQGGAFTVHLTGKLPVDGFVVIAPGGNVDHYFFMGKISGSVARARQLVADGKGNEPVALDDFEGARGVYPVTVAPAVYLTWFDADSAMSMEKSARAANPAIPILWIVPTREAPGLRKMNVPMFRSLPANPRTKLYEPDSDHRGAPTASAEEIARWINEVAGAAK